MSIFSHVQYLNATRSPRCRYNVREVRGKADITLLKVGNTATSDLLTVPYNELSDRYAIEL